MLCAMKPVTYLVTRLHRRFDGDVILWKGTFDA